MSHPQLIACLVAGILALAPACADGGERIDSESLAVRDRLIAAYREERGAPEAIRHLEEAVQLLPEDPLVQSLYGQALAEEGDLQQAIFHLRESVRFAPDVANTHYQLGHAVARSRRMGEFAALHFERCIELDPSIAEAYVNLGTIRLKNEEFDEAIQLFHQAIAMRPNLVPAHYNLSLALFRTERLEEAIPPCQAALTLDPKLYQAYDHLGSIYTKQGRHLEAVAMYQKAVDLAPDYNPALLNLSRAKRRLQ